MAGLEISSYLSRFINRSEHIPGVIQELPARARQSPGIEIGGGGDSIKLNTIPSPANSIAGAFTRPGRQFLNHSGYTTGPGFLDRAKACVTRVRDSITRYFSPRSHLSDVNLLPLKNMRLENIQKPRREYASLTLSLYDWEHLADFYETPPQKPLDGVLRKSTEWRETLNTMKTRDDNTKRQIKLTQLVRREDLQQLKEKFAQSLKKSQGSSTDFQEANKLLDELNKALRANSNLKLNPRLRRGYEDIIRDK